jgi:predicted RNA-binding Zn ribbon-like protein
VSEPRNPSPRLVGGHPVVDLVNTVEPRLPGAAPREHLADPAGLLRWALRAGVVDDAEAAAIRAAWAAAPPAAVRALRAAVDVREAAYAVLAASLDPAASGPAASGPAASGPAVSGPAVSGPAASGPAAGPDLADVLERLAMRWTSAAARTDLVPAGPPGPAVRPVVGTDPAMLIPDRLAYAAVELLTRGDLSRLRACPPALGGCGWLFLDHSRNGTRRWCAMDDCGTRAKARRLTARRRAARGATSVA